MLPAGTDLMVYFNRFVSNEGTDKDGPGGGLIVETTTTQTSDFREDTGEPLLKASVNDKIFALGAAFCAKGKVTQGGAFGNFEPEPVGPISNASARIYNIVDSSRDINQTANAAAPVQQGYVAFMDGFRWNHHLYCDE